MRRTRAGALVLAAGLLATSTAPADSPTPTAATAATPPPIVVQPPQLQALLAKMVQLQVNSESFTKTVQVTSPFPVGVGKRRRTQTRHTSEASEGEVSISPLEGAVTNVTAHTPAAIEIGSSAYLYIQALAKRDHGRPWVHFGPPHSAAFELFPYHGGSSSELNDGGSGPYAGLINLLATASSTVSVAGPIAIDGQQTTAFTAMVEPLKLSKSAQVRELAKALGADHREKLEVFITESGLPIRVVVMAESHISKFSSKSTDTTDITSINVPFTVTAPPAGKTISEARLKKLLGPAGRLLSAVGASAAAASHSHRISPQK